MEKRELLSPSDDTASRALIDVQTATTRVKAIISECVSKGIPDDELTKRLNEVIAVECKRIKDAPFREQFRKALITSARKWHYQLMQTYRINEQNFANAVKQQPMNVELKNLLGKTPFQKQFDFRRILDDGTNPGIPVIRDYQKGLKLAVRAISAEPPKIITPKNGKAYVMSARLRAEMAVRYSAAVDSLQRLIDDGVNWCWISSHPNCSERCKDFQGKLYSLFDKPKEIDGKTYNPSGTVDGIPYEYIGKALAGPKDDGNGCISGYNCRHRAIAYEKGSRPPADYTDAEIKKAYAIDKQQRSYENRIRHLKQEEAQLRACGMTEEAKALRKKWRVLTRDYQIYSIQNDRAYYPYRYIVDRTEVEQGNFETEKPQKPLTNLKSADIIVNKYVKTALGENTPSIEDVLKNGDPSFREAYQKYQGALKIGDAHYKKDKDHNYHFSPSKKAIFIDIDADAKPSDQYKKQYSIFFHETAHHIDYIIGQKIAKNGHASTLYESKKYKASFNYMIIEECNEFMNAYRDKFSRRTGKVEISQEEIYNEIREDFLDARIVDKAELSDILDGVTKGEMQRKGYGLGASHTAKNPDYWNGVQVGVEAFAHFACASMTNPKSKEMLMHIFPKSYEIYEEIMQL